jgi:ERCC4-type nuclease
VRKGNKNAIAGQIEQSGIGSDVSRNAVEGYIVEINFDWRLSIAPSTSPETTVSLVGVEIGFSGEYSGE